MANPKVDYPVTTTFGRRIAQNRADKIRVAEKVTSMFMGPGTSAFIGDGSSTFYVGLELFTQNRQATIWTNHLAIAHEFALWDSPHGKLPATSVYLSEGEVNANLMMTAGDRSITFADSKSKRALNVILSVKHLFSEQGPAGSDQLSLEVKQSAAASAMPSGRRIIFLADFSKMTVPFTQAVPLVFPAERDWYAVRDQPNVFVVATRHPEAPETYDFPVSPKSELEYYMYHSHKLRYAMGKRYIEV